jgi:PAS domain S-box-containing protein
VNSHADDQTDSLGSWLAAIVESSDDPIVSKGVTGIVASWNKAAEEIVGRPITMVFPPDRLDEEAEFLARIGRGERVDHYETVRLHKDGWPIRVSLTISPIKDSSGRIIGASKIVRDLTERDEQARRIRELEKQLDHQRGPAVIGQVLTALVHEISQPLTAIRNCVAACRHLVASGEQTQVQIGWNRLPSRLIVHGRSCSGSGSS